MSQTSQPASTPLGGNPSDPNQLTPTPLDPQTVVTPTPTINPNTTTNSELTHDYQDPQTAAQPETQPPVNPATP